MVAVDEIEVGVRMGGADAAATSAAAASTAAASPRSRLASRNRLCRCRSRRSDARPKPCRLRGIPDVGGDGVDVVEVVVGFKVANG